jgi:tetratricopeptide (TPR) repeat protein
MKEKIVFSLKILIILSIICLTALIYFQQGDFTSLDLGRHLKNGQIVWQEPGVLFKNFYSYTDTNFPFINHHWLSGVIFWWLYLIGGFKILTVLNIILGILTALIVFKLTVKKSNFWLSSILILPVILLLSERVDIRPEMFSYVFIVLTYYLLEDFRETNNTKKLIWLVPMFLFWVNLHIYFFIGLFFIGLAMLEQLILHYKDFFKVESGKKFFYIALASAAACLFNPNFIKGLTYPFNIMKKYGYDIVENKSPFYLETLTINYNITIFKIFLGLLVLSFILSIIIKRKIHPVKSSQAGAKLFNGVNFYNLALAVVFSVFACLYIRNLPLFGLIILPVMAQNYFQAARYFKEKPVKMEIIILASVFMIYGLVLSLIVGDNSGEKKFLNKNFGLGMSQGSLGSIKFYQTNNLRGPIFNNYDLGGALIFWLYPGERVFVDNRPEAYSVEFFGQIYKPMQEDEAKWKELSARFNINLIYFSHTDGTPWARKFLAARLHDDNWPLIYFDDYTVIMITDGDNNKFLIEKNKINNDKFVFRLEELLKSANDKERVYLAELAVLYGRADLAENIYQIILAKRPDDGKILASLGFLYAGGAKNEDVLKSLEYLAKAIRSGYKLPAVYNQLGLDYWNLADYNEAKNMWQKALRLDPNNEHAKYYLDQANGLIK